MTAPWTALPAEKLFRLPQAAFDGYLVRLDPSKPSGFEFVSRDETVDLHEGDNFITFQRDEMFELLGGRHPAHLFPGVPAINSVEREAVGLCVELKCEARRRSKGNDKRYHRELARLTRARIRVAERELRDRGQELSELEDQIVTLQTVMDGDLTKWLAGPLRLQRPEGSSLHKMQQAYKSKAFFIIHESLEVTSASSGNNWFEDLESFVVEHDWATVLSGAEVSGHGGEIQLSAPASTFEFMVNGRRVAGVVGEPGELGPDHFNRVMLLTCELSTKQWVLLRVYNITDTFEAVPIGADTPEKISFNVQVQPLADLIASNIKAICIMLEAQVAQTEVVRVDAKLNRAREKRGKLPLTDYHVVSLTRRERALPRPQCELDPDREIRHVRMHFRRGHWRHYQDHRTWIKWCLVGDPDLGIIEKHYRL